MRKAILYTGGVLNILLALFHILFWKMLNWKEELPKLSVDNQGVLQVSNIIMIALLLYFSMMSFAMVKHERLDFFGKSVVLLISGFYAMRVILGYPFFGFNMEEMFIWIFCAIISVGYFSILFMKTDH